MKSDMKGKIEWIDIWYAFKLACELGKLSILKDIVEDMHYFKGVADALEWVLGGRRNLLENLKALLKIYKGNK